VVEMDKKTDLSESGWLYLFFLVILIVEQALAGRVASFPFRWKLRCTASVKAATA
jgi:hypothetical protein